MATENVTSEFVNELRVVEWGFNPAAADVTGLRIMRARYPGRDAYGDRFQAGDWIVWESATKRAIRADRSMLVVPTKTTHVLVERKVRAPRPATGPARPATANKVNCHACGEFRPGNTRPGDAPTCYACQRAGY